MSTDLPSYRRPDRSHHSLDGKYGEITSSKRRFHPGEPVFVLRAQDPLAVEAIEFYGELCANAGCDPEHVASVSRHAYQIDEWQRKYPERVKDKPGPTGKLSGATTT